MFGFVLLMTSYLATIQSKCFLPPEMPPFPAGLNSTAESNTTVMGLNEDQLEDEIELLREWEASMEKHILSYLHRHMTCDEWMECYSDSVTFNFADGPGSALDFDEHRIISKTYQELLTKYSFRDGSAEFIDDHTIEVEFIQTASGQFGFMRGVLPWITAMSDVEDNDGEIGFESWVKLRFHIDDEGLIEEFIIVSPQFLRQILGALLSFYVTTQGPFGQDMGQQETLTLFGYNYFVVIIITLISVMTTLVGICVFISMRFCARRGSEPVLYKKVEIVTDTEMEQ